MIWTARGVTVFLALSQFLNAHSLCSCNVVNLGNELRLSGRASSVPFSLLAELGVNSFTGSWSGHD